MSDTTPQTTGRKTAGAFDVRTIIGALLAVYGLILLLMGIFADTEPEKTSGINANLWAGLALLAVGGFFVAWWKLRPIVVPDTDDDAGSRTPPSGH